MEIDCGTQLKQDFLLFLDMCKDPDEVFPPKSAESTLTKQWINHLCTYKADNLKERRLKNIYMSYLCAALIDGKLKGPFLKEPIQGKLEKVDFEAVSACATNDAQLGISSTMQPPCSSQLLPSYGQNFTNMSMALNSDLNYSYFTKYMNSTGQESQGLIAVDSATANTLIPVSCYSPPQPCQCAHEGNRCTCNRATGGADSTQLCKNTPFQSSKNQPLLDDTKATSSNLLVSSVDQIPSTLSFPDYEGMLDNKIKLLEAISAELRGDIEPGSNDYLERQFSRYKTFIMSDSELAPYYRTLPSGLKLRNSLLLKFQNDLVQLINVNIN